MASISEIPTIVPSPALHERAGGRRAWLSWGLLVAIGLTILVAAPVAAVFAFVLQPTNGLWTHLVHTLLLEYLGNSSV